MFPLLFRASLLAILALTVAARVAVAQASIVPVTHLVYDWLQHQRVAGRLPTYQHELRPMSRATIAAHLAHLDSLGDRVPAGDRHVLRDFQNEFVMARLLDNRLVTPGFLRGLPRTIGGALRERREPALFALVTPDSLLSGALYATAGGGALDLSSPDSAAYATTKGVRLYGNARFGLGWHYEFDNLWNRKSQLLLVQQERYHSDRLGLGVTSAFAFESYLSYRAPRWFEGYVGWGGSVIGPAITDPLVLRADAPPQPGVRVQFGGPRLNLAWQHGTLRAPNVEDTTGTALFPVYARSAARRYFVAHRLTWMPHPRVSLALNEQVIYANRELEFAYLNPVVPMTFVQDRIGDRDNVMLGGDVVVRPWDGTELIGAFLWDDRSAPNPDARSFGPFKKSALLGIEQQLPFGVRLGLGYTWTDPWVYTHWQRVVTYESLDRPLGPLIGPNSEEAAARLTTWWPLRTRIMTGYRRQRRGLDPPGAATDISQCVGGNLLCGTLAKESPRFQGADMHVIDRYEVEAWTEPVRGFPFFLLLRDSRVRQGTQLQSSRFVHFGFRVGY